MSDSNTCRVVVTGGSGFIGTNLIQHFSSQGCSVVNLDTAQPRDHQQRPSWIPCDLREADALAQRLRELAPHILIHMGARTDLDGRSLQDYAANIAGVENLVAGVRDVPSLERILFASSRLVCKIGYHPETEDDYCPTTVYGQSKVIGEQIVRSAADRLRCPWAIVRPTSIWGPWFDIPYKTFFLTIANGRYFHPGSRQIHKSFGFVGNTVYQIQKLLDADADAINGKTFYLADYPAIEVGEMANTINTGLGRRDLRSVAVPILRVAARTGDLLKLLGWKRPPLTSFRLNNLLTPMVHDMSLLQAVVGVLPYSMPQGVELTLQWMRDHGELPCL